MCYIMTAYQHTADDGEFMQMVKEMLSKNYDKNKDALFIRTPTQDFRTADKKTGKEQIERIEEGFVLSHSRWGTSGDNTEMNAHGWKQYGWRMVHNGFVSGCIRYGKTSKGFCDSAIFFQEIAERVSKAKDDEEIASIVEQHAQDNYFSGRCILWNEKRNIALLFGDWQMYIFKTGFVISSSDISEVAHPKWQFRGIQWEGRQECVGGLPVTKVTIKNAWRIDNFMDSTAFEFSFVKNWTFTKPYVPPVTAPSSHVASGSRADYFAGLVAQQRLDGKQLMSQKELLHEREKELNKKSKKKKFRRIEFRQPLSGHMIEYCRRHIELHETAGVVWLTCDDERLKQNMQPFMLPHIVRNQLWYQYHIPFDTVDMRMMWQLLTKGVVWNEMPEDSMQQLMLQDANADV